MNDTLISRLRDFSQRHRMMFGMHPNNNLLVEAADALEALSAPAEAESQDAPATTTKTAKKKA